MRCQMCDREGPVSHCPRFNNPDCLYRETFIRRGDVRVRGGSTSGTAETPPSAATRGDSSGEGWP